MNRGVLVSVAFGSEMTPPAGTAVRRRKSDWGVSGWRRRLTRATEMVALVWAARRHQALLVLTAGPEVAAVAVACRLLARRTRLVIADPLLPPWPSPALAWAYRMVDHFVVIRRRDVDLLRDRFRVTWSSFVHWPGDVAAHPESSDGDYVYAAGWAHRDWPTLVAAAGKVPARFVIAADLPRDGLPDRVEVVGPLSPDEGRILMRAAGVVALPLVDNDYPSGPLVLLDAMAAGKPVVATRTGGTVDYVRDGEDARLLPPGDVEAMAEALSSLLSDERERRRLGAAARTAASGFSSNKFWRHCLQQALTSTS